MKSGNRDESAIEMISKEVLGSTTNMILPGVFAILSFLFISAGVSDSVVLFPIEDVAELKALVDNLESERKKLLELAVPSQDEYTVLMAGNSAGMWLKRVADSDQKILKNKGSSYSDYQKTRSELKAEFYALAGTVSKAEELTKKYNLIRAHRKTLLEENIASMKAAKTALKKKSSISANLSVITSNFLVLALLGSLLGVIIERLTSGFIVYKMYSNRYVKEHGANIISEENISEFVQNEISKIQHAGHFDVEKINSSRRYLIESCLNNAIPFFLLCCALAVYIICNFGSKVGGGVSVVIGAFAAVGLYQSGYIFYRNARFELEQYNSFAKILIEKEESFRKIRDLAVEKARQLEAMNSEKIENAIKNAVKESLSRP